MMGPEKVFETSLGYLIRGNSLHVLREIPDETVAVVFADPPFNVGKDYGPDVDDAMPDPEYREWCRDWLWECVRILVDGGALFVYNLPRHNVHLAAWLESCGMVFRHWIAIRMTNRPALRGKLYPAHYSLLYMTRGRPRTFHRLRTPLERCRHCAGLLKDYGGYAKMLHPEGITLTDVWTDAQTVRHRSTKDPARIGGQGPDPKRNRQPSKRGNQLPLVIPERCILMASDPGDLVVDPFLGSGTTAEAAERHGRRWLGIEIGDTGPAVRRLQKLQEAP